MPVSEDDYEVCQCNDSTQCGVANCMMGTYTMNITVSGGPILFTAHGTLTASLVPDPGGTATGTVTLEATF
jgi:hypothetical protein